MIYRDTCPICGGAAVSIFSWPFNSLGRACALERLPAELAAGFSSAGFEIKQCANCDFTFQRVAPDEEEILHVYALHADEAAIRSEIASQKLHWFAHMTEGWSPRARRECWTTGATGGNGPAWRSPSDATSRRWK